MAECIGKYYIEDGTLRDTWSFNVSVIYEGEVVYEVLRVIDGIPLFFEDHLDRMEDSLRLVGRKALSSGSELLECIKILVRENEIRNGNIKIIYHFSSSRNRSMVYNIEAQYPERQLYETGVDTILFDAERKNPGAKVFNFRLRSSILDELVRKSAYEAFLVNSHECITEGSRSNVYFIKGNSVITAADEFVLGGITRKYVLKICAENSIKLEYRCFPVHDLDKAEAVFLSGTSPHLLPVRIIDDFMFRVDHPVLKTLIDSYCAIVESYISMRKELEQI